jgi:hypothetical protein
VRATWLIGELMGRARSLSNQWIRSEKRN